MNRFKYVIAAMLALATAVEASQFRGFDRRTQVEGSDVIVIGRVSNTHSHWNAERSVILTESEIAVDDVWKGSLSDNRIVVRTLGGSVEGIELKVDGSPSFSTGERVVLFLTRNGESFSLWGMKFGKLLVEGEGDGAFALGSLPTNITGVGAAAEQVSLSLGDLRTEVSDAVEGR